MDDPPFPGSRRGPRVLLALALVALGIAGHAQPAASVPAAPELSFDDALALALEKSPRLRTLLAEVRFAEADLLGARAYPFNPVLEASRTGRDDGSRSTRDHEVAISQELEIAGQRGKRIGAASASLETARARFERGRQVFVAEVGAAFVAALRARELAALAAFEQDIARGLTAFEQRRLDAGAGTLVDLNLARAAEGRARRQVELARADDAAARAALAERLGLAPAALPPLAGELAREWPAPAALEEIERRALERRQDLVALRAEGAAAAARLRLERSLAAPSLVLGVARGREEDVEDLTTAAAGLSLPIFQRNQGGIATARAGQEAVAAATDSATLTVRSEVAAAHGRFEAATRALTVFQETVAGTLEENLELVQKSFAAGKLRASEVLVFRREFVDSRRELIEAAAEAWLARIALDLAAGDTQVPVAARDSTPPTLPETSR
jgi:cobalt-zinc-cadmium efflux system outer membrane protein